MCCKVKLETRCTTFSNSYAGLISTRLDALHSISRDLVHAARSLAKDRGFTLVCVISLGIGMGALVALATFTRTITAPARVINTDGLTELLVLPLGPLRAKAGEWALEQWSYPDYQALRDADTGMAITGWTRESSRVRRRRRPDDEAPPRVATLYVSSNYFSTFGVSLARGPGFDPAIDDAPSAEPRVVLSDDFWRSRMASDPDIIGKSVTRRWRPAYGGRDHAGRLSRPLPFLPGAGLAAVHSRWSGTLGCKANPNLRDDRTVDWVRIHGRLNPGVDITQANALVSATVAGLAQRYPASNEFKAATVEPYASMGAAGRPESRRVTSVMLEPGGSGAPDRVPEHLRHDAGPRRQPRARAVDPRGARRGPAAAHPASVLRSHLAGVCAPARSARSCCSAFPRSRDGIWARRCLKRSISTRPASRSRRDCACS